MSLALISHPDCELHDPGPEHPEQPARVKVIQEALLAYPFKKAPQFYETPIATLLKKQKPIAVSFSA